MWSTVRAIWKDVSGRGRTVVGPGEGIDTLPSAVRDSKLRDEKITETSN